MRESFYFRVKYQLLSSAEYENKRAEWKEELSFDRKGLNSEEPDADNHSKAVSVDPCLLRFLLEMDEKLDRLMALLAGKGTHEDSLEEAVGLDLSGGGMKMRTEKLLEKGQILCANLILSRSPLAHVRILGEVVSVGPSMGEDTAGCDVSVRFLDLPSEERERIIACVFQRQREALRKRKGQEK